MTGERDADHDPLAHAAGKLIGITGENIRRISYMNGFKHRKRLLSGFFPTDLRMRADDVLHLLRDGEDRIQAGHRLLEDHGNIAPAKCFHLFLALSQKLFPQKLDRACDPFPTAARQEARHGKGGH